VVKKRCQHPLQLKKAPNILQGTGDEEILQFTAYFCDEKI